ncbi:hypothetical protein [Robbsia andropogonis]|uniref:hypothetical protein n=1 Tax=Robbsia andropogonis TaxID=28092 RepID=UPI0004661E07|nr:hypothetical protein [Robbsia andropogonis]
METVGKTTLTLITVVLHSVALSMPEEQRAKVADSLQAAATYLSDSAQDEQQLDAAQLLSVYADIARGDLGNASDLLAVFQKL